MDERDLRIAISNVGKEFGFKVKSMYRNPLTKSWRVEISEREQVSFTPEPDSTAEECVEQFKRLLGIGEIDVEEELDNLRLRTPDNVLAAMQRLRRAGEIATQRLLEVLLDPREPGFYRSRVADTLAMIGTPVAIKPLVELLNDPEAEVRWHAVKALEEIGDETAIAPLERVATTDTGSFSITPALRVDVREDARKAIKQIKAHLK